MPQRRISLWGMGLGRVGLPTSITVRGDDGTEDVVRSLERRTGLVVCGGPRSEGTALSQGRAVSRHYACTLGRRIGQREYSVEAEIWWAEPIATDPREEG